MRKILKGIFLLPLTKTTPTDEVRNLKPRTDSQYSDRTPSDDDLNFLYKQYVSRLEIV